MRESPIDKFIVYKKGCGAPLPEHHTCLDEDNWEIVLDHFGPIRSLVETIIAHSTKNLEDINKDIIINVEGLCLRLQLQLIDQNEY